jgi:hypothetical protein
VPLLCHYSTTTQTYREGAHVAELSIEETTAKTKRRRRTLSSVSGYVGVDLGVEIYYLSCQLASVQTPKKWAISFLGSQLHLTQGERLVSANLNVVTVPILHSFKLVL